MRSPLRLLHVVDSLERGGLERVVADLAVAQRDAGHSVEVLCLYRRGAIASELEAAGVPVACVDKRHGPDPRPLLRVRHRLLGSPWDIVHAHNFVPGYYAAIALLGAGRAPALVSSCHDMGTRLANPRLRLLFRWALRRSARVAMVADQVYERYVRDGYVPPSRAQMIPNGIPVGRFAPTLSRRFHARSLLGLGPDEVVVGCVGRLVPIKNQALAVRAVARLLPAHPTLRLVIVGGGPLEGELRSLAGSFGMASRLSLTGERADVADLLPAFDVFSLPSLSEGLSIALLEAASTALPIVATDVGGNSKVIRHGENGMLVPSGDAEALIAAMDGLLRDSTLRRRLGDKARQWAIGHASIDAQRVAFDHLYEGALLGD